MNEKLIEQLAKLTDVCHWLGKYNESNTLSNLIRIFRTFEIQDLEELEKRLTTLPEPNPFEDTSK